jgi:hypothetical protein
MTSHVFPVFVRLSLTRLPVRNARTGTGIHDRSFVFLTGTSTVVVGFAPLGETMSIKSHDVHPTNSCVDRLSTQPNLRDTSFIWYTLQLENSPDPAGVLLVALC